MLPPTAPSDAGPTWNGRHEKSPLPKYDVLFLLKFVSLRAVLFESKNQLSSELLEEAHKLRNCVRELIGVHGR